MAGFPSLMAEKYSTDTSYTMFFLSTYLLMDVQVVFMPKVLRVVLQ